MQGQDVRASLDLVDFRAWNGTSSFCARVGNRLVFVTVADESWDFHSCEVDWSFPFHGHVEDQGIVTAWVDAVSGPSLQKLWKLCNDSWIFGSCISPLLKLIRIVSSGSLKHLLQKTGWVLHGGSMAHSGHEAGVHEELVGSASELFRVCVIVVACNGSFGDESAAFVRVSESELQNSGAAT